MFRQIMCADSSLVQPFLSAQIKQSLNHAEAALAQKDPARHEAFHNHLLEAERLLFEAADAIRAEDAQTALFYERLALKLVEVNMTQQMGLLDLSTNL